jgi:hypothetical protein
MKTNYRVGRVDVHYHYFRAKMKFLYAVKTSTLIEITSFRHIELVGLDPLCMCSNIWARCYSLRFEVHGIRDKRHGIQGAYTSDHYFRTYISIDCIFHFKNLMAKFQDSYC